MKDSNVYFVGEDLLRDREEVKHEVVAFAKNLIKLGYNQFFFPQTPFGEVALEAISQLREEFVFIKRIIFFNDDIGRKNIEYKVRLGEGEGGKILNLKDEQGPYAKNVAIMKMPGLVIMHMPVSSKEMEYAVQNHVIFLNSINSLKF